MKPNASIALDITGVTVNYGAATILDRLDLQVRSGEIYALLGANGAGKSTTINALLGFVTPAAGSVRVCGIDVATDARRARLAMAYLPENVVLYEYLSARENLAYFLRVAGAAPASTVIDAALTQVALAADAWDRRLSTYSKGMRQKTAIALAVARGVPVLLLDEPTSGLDPQATGEFNALLRGLRDQGVTILMVTHDLLSAAEVADRIGFLSGGALRAQYEAQGPDRFDVRALYRSYGAAREAA